MHVCQINGNKAVMIRRQYSANRTWSWLVILQPRCSDRNSTIEQTLFCCNRFMPIPTGFVSASTLEAESNASNAIASRMWSRQMIMSTVFYPYSIITCYHKRMQDIGVCHVAADSHFTRMNSTPWSGILHSVFSSRHSRGWWHTAAQGWKKWWNKRTLRWHDLDGRKEKKRSEQYIVRSSNP